LEFRENLPLFIENIFLVLRFQEMYIFRINKMDQNTAGQERFNHAFITAENAEGRGKTGLFPYLLRFPRFLMI
jgi:hypothetical protein